jgi:hypothetical protein
MLQEAGLAPVENKEVTLNKGELTRHEESIGGGDCMSDDLLGVRREMAVCAICASSLWCAE